MAYYDKMAAMALKQDERIAELERELEAILGEQDRLRLEEEERRRRE